MRKVYILSLAILLTACSSGTPTETHILENPIDCVPSIYEKSEDEYQLLKNQFSQNYPQLEVYDAGSLCKFINGSILVTYSYWNDNKGKQRIVLFDRVGKILRAADLECPVQGDLSYPKFVSTRDSDLVFRCGGSDVGLDRTHTYLLNMDTFDLQIQNE